MSLTNKPRELPGQSFVSLEISIKPLTFFTSNAFEQEPWNIICVDYVNNMNMQKGGDFVQQDDRMEYIL